jgi:hypothetical protein
MKVAKEEHGVQKILGVPPGIARQGRCGDLAVYRRGPLRGDLGAAFISISMAESRI